jgi:hypothetical protein
MRRTHGWTVAVVLLVAPATAAATEVTRFSGHITDVGIQRGPGQVGGVEYRIRGSFALDPAINLGASIVTLEMLFAELGVGGAGELVTMMDDASFLPYELIPKSGTPDKVLYDTPDFRPQIRMQIWRSRDGGEFRIKLDRALMRRVPQLCTNDPRLSTTDMTHAFTVDDGTNPPVLVETTQPWECNPKDNNMRARGRRSLVPAPVPTSSPGTPIPTATPAAPSGDGCASLSSRPEARLLAEPVTRVTGEPDAITLDGRASVARLGTLVRYRFESGDGRVQDGPDPIAVFTYAPGDYRAWLTVYDDRGACAQVSRGFSDK